MASSTRFAIETDTYLSDAKSLYLISAAKFQEEGGSYNTYLENTSGATKLIDGPTRTMTANRFTTGTWDLKNDGVSLSGENILNATRYKAGLWEYRSDGVFYNGENVLNQLSGMIDETRSSIRLSRLQDGQVRGNTQASTSRQASTQEGGLGRRLQSTWRTIINNEAYQPLDGGP